MHIHMQPEAGRGRQGGKRMPYPISKQTDAKRRPRSGTILKNCFVQKKKKKKKERNIHSASSPRGVFRVGLVLKVHRLHRGNRILAYN